MKELTKVQLDKQTEELRALIISRFPNYGSEFPETFIEDIIDDVKECSDFNYGCYSDGDISLAIERVTLGRLGHPEWAIFNRKDKFE